MKIAEIRIEPCTMPKADPNWKFALAASPVSEGWIFCITTEDGTTGYGYGSAMAHYGAPVDAVKSALGNFADILKGRDSTRINEILWDLDRHVVGNNQPKAAVDGALHDLLARRLKIPLCQLFGGSTRDHFPSLRILAIKSPEDMAASALSLFETGVRYFKIKVHGDVEDDIARVAAIRKALGPEANLTIDANQSYTPKAAIRAINGMAEHRIDLVEQPVARDDLQGLKLVTESVPVVVEADEAADSLDDVMTLASGRYVDAVSLKIAKLGGLRNTLAAARICEAAHIRYRLGAHVGPRLIAAQATHMAAALPGIWYANELSEFARLLDDPFEGMEEVDGTVKLPSGPGSGVVPRAGKLGQGTGR